jgi:hypothetical protein
MIIYGYVCPEIASSVQLWGNGTGLNPRNSLRVSQPRLTQPRLTQPSLTQPRLTQSRLNQPLLT